MYPINNASPERIAVGQVVLIADGTIQSSGVAITVRGQAGAEAGSAGTIAYGADNTVYYTPTQAETNFTSFVVIASKASCFSASQTIITTASATAGEVRLEGVTHTSAVIPTVTTVGTTTTNTDMRGTDSALLAANINLTGGAVDNVTTVGTTTTNTDMRGTDSALLAASINLTAGAVDVVTLVTTTTTNTDMRGTDSANTTVPDAAGTAQTIIGTGGASLGDLGGMSTAMKAEVNAEADTALTDYDGPTNAEMEARTPTAAELAYIVSNSADGKPCTFTGGTTTTAILGNVDGVAASSTNDVYNGRILIFNAGTLDEQATDITDYDGATTTATITAVTTAVTASHTANLK